MRVMWLYDIWLSSVRTRCVACFVNARLLLVVHDELYNIKPNSM